MKRAGPKTSRVRSEYRNPAAQLPAPLSLTFPFRGMTCARKTVYSFEYRCGEERLKRLWTWVTEKED
jgi:hypothetical protein